MPDPSHNLRVNSGRVPCRWLPRAGEPNSVSLLERSVLQAIDIRKTATLSARYKGRVNQIN